MKDFIYSFFFFIITFNSFAQIIANRTINSAIKITSTGIIGKMNNTEISSTNLAIGENSLQSASEVINNTAIGYNALLNNGINFPNVYNNNNNTAVGASALFQNQQGYNNSALGWATLTGGTGYGNTAFGRTCMTYNNSGSNNSALGFAALSANTSGSYNTGFGVFSLTANQTTNYNTAFGISSMDSDLSGTNNVAFGNNSLQANISGNSNTSFGNASMFGNKTGNTNVGFGYYVLLGNDGQSNTVVGNTALDQNTTGINNVVMGNYALHTNITGTGNVAIGNYAGYFDTGSNKLFIDANSVPFNGNVTTIGGDFAANKVCVGCNLALTGANDFGTRTEAFQVQGAAFKKLGNGTWQFPSDRRLKTNIVLLNSNQMLEKILQMQGVNYDLIANPEQGMQYGFIAQDLRKIFPTKIYENSAGFLSASYGDFVPMFIEAIKALNERVEKLENNQPNIKSMAARVEEMEAILKK